MPLYCFVILLKRLVFRFFFHEPMTFKTEQVWCCKIMNNEMITVKDFYNEHPWDPKIVAVVHSWSLSRVINLCYERMIWMYGTSKWWPLQAGGRSSEMVFSSGLTVYQIKVKTLVMTIVIGPKCCSLLEDYKW